MSHAYHEGQPGYSETQILHDGCGECKQRSNAVWMAINYMDYITFAAAWKRAVEYERGGLDDVSAAELPVLRALWAVAVQLERRGIPIGVLPSADWLTAFEAVQR